MNYNVYLISVHLENEICYKIGWTKRDPIKRLKELKTANSHDLNIVSIFESKWGPKIESNLHRKFSYLNKNGEWFSLSIDDVKNFKETCQKIHDSLELMSKENTWFQEQKIYSKYL